MRIGPVEMDTDLEVGLALCFMTGSYVFFRGFRVFREYRVLADTPEVPIRSMPIGLVRIHGNARGDQLVSSPVSNTKCLFYKVDIKAYQADSEGDWSWNHVAADADGVQFYLEDKTGRVLLDAHGADFDLIQSCKRETGSGTRTRLWRTLWGEGDPWPTSASRLPDHSLVTYAESVIAGERGSSFGDSLVSDLANGSLSFSHSGKSPTGQYRLTEHCILPGHCYDVTGTCVENPSPADEHDRNMIVKGQNEPTFLISWRSEKGTVATLRKRAAIYILGGAGLSIVSLALLLISFGWL